MMTSLVAIAFLLGSAQTGGAVGSVPKPVVGAAGGNVGAAPRSVPGAVPGGNIGAASGGNVGTSRGGNVGASGGGNIGTVPGGAVGRTPAGAAGAGPRGNIGATPGGNIAGVPGGNVGSAPLGKMGDRSRGNVHRVPKDIVRRAPKDNVHVVPKAMGIVAHPPGMSRGNPVQSIPPFGTGTLEGYTPVQPKLAPLNAYVDDNGNIIEGVNPAAVAIADAADPAPADILVALEKARERLNAVNDGYGGRRAAAVVQVAHALHQLQNGRNDPRALSAVLPSKTGEPRWSADGKVLAARGELAAVARKLRANPFRYGDAALKALDRAIDVLDAALVTPWPKSDP